MCYGRGSGPAPISHTFRADNIAIHCVLTGSAAFLLPQLQQRLRRGFAVVSGEDSHDDFKPKYKAEPVDDVTSTIEADIKGNEVFIYMKVGATSGSQQAPGH